MSTIPRQTGQVGFDRDSSVNTLQPFGACSIWDHQRDRLAGYGPREEAAVQEQVATPILARAVAEMIVGSWRDAHDAGRLDPGRPLVILELMAGDGRFASQTLTTLKRLVEDTPLADSRILFLLSDPRPERLSACWNHSCLWPWLQSGELDTVCFDPESGRHLDVRSRRLVFGPQSLANPLVVIANGVFGSLPQSLYHAHFGRLFEGFVEVALQDDTQFDADSPGPLLQVNYDWREAVSEQPYQALLNAYSRDLDSHPLLVPTTALNCVDRLSELCRAGMLLISADRGYYTERQLRTQFEPEFGALGRYFLPLNGHVLARYASMQGGGSLQTQPHEGGVLYSALSFGSPDLLGSRASNAFRQSFVARSPDDFRVVQLGLEERAAEFLPAEMLAQLRLSCWDHHVLAACLPRLLENPPELTPGDRLRWVDALERVWQGYYSVGGDAQLVIDTAMFAMQLGAWGFARRCFDSLHPERTDDAANQYNLALCCLHTEDRVAARCAIRNAVSMDPDCEETHALASAINAWAGHCDNLGWHDANLCREGDLSVHPLGMHHASAVLYQARDPNTTVQTCLPGWKDEAEVVQWIAEQHRLSNQACCAVIHKTHGFVGMVNLYWNGDLGYFYFWTGADHQNQGFGTRAARLLFNLAEERLGTAKIYTCAFRDNHRSERALLALDFSGLPFEARKPDQDAVFYVRRPEKEGLVNCHDELVALLRAIDSPIVVAAFPSGQEES